MLIDWTRTALEYAREAAGWMERAKIVGEDGGVIDQRHVSLAHRPKRKWYIEPRDLESVTSICAHITAVRGGFGSRKSDIRKHEERGVSHDDAVRLAQADRFLAVPYHDVSSRALVRNLPSHVASWHGNGCNRYALGYAIDMASGEPFDVKLEQARFEMALRSRRRDCPSLMFIEAHRQHSASRGGDPGRAVFRALLDVAYDHGMTDRRYHTTGSGRPLPADWLLG